MGSKSLLRESKGKDGVRTEKKKMKKKHEAKPIKLGSWSDIVDKEKEELTVEKRI